MAFQFDALIALAGHIAALEASTGRNVGYARSGRVTPLVSEKARANAERDALAAPETWGSRAEYCVMDAVPESCLQWISPESASYGVVLDTVSARVDPRAYVQTLAAAMPGVVLEGATVDMVDPNAGAVHVDGDVFSAGTIVLASGWQIGDLLAPFAGDWRGIPVKGQAAMFDACAEGLPVIYQDGLYMVPHKGGRIAVGSTSEKQFDDPFGTDSLLDDVIAKARAICPALRHARVVERWAGLRPKPPGREPVIGPLPGYPNVWLAAGGFKISFGIAHAVAEVVVSRMSGQSPVFSLPSSFDPATRSLEPT